MLAGMDSSGFRSSHGESARTAIAFESRRPLVTAPRQNESDVIDAVSTSISIAKVRTNQTCHLERT